MFDYETVPLHWVNRLGFLTRKELGNRFRAAGVDVSPEEWAVLLILWQKGAQTPGALADVTFRDRTTITRLIDGMVAKGLVARGADPNDRRRSLVDVSDAGRALEAKLVSIARVLITEALDGIAPADIEATLRTLRRMTLNLHPTDVGLSVSKPPKE